jgi:hypothetical protein
MAVEAAHSLRLPPAMQQLSRLRDTVAISHLDFHGRSEMKISHPGKDEFEFLSSLWLQFVYFVSK